jgi:hypothetical protein
MILAGRFYMPTSLSRKLPGLTSKLLKLLVLNYGIPLRYYVDSHGYSASFRGEIVSGENHQIHSTTSEISSIRFEKARKEGNSLFRPFTLPKPYTSTKDVSCLQGTRMVKRYRKISLFNHEIAVPNIPLREHVEIHMIPYIQREALEVRIWWENRLVQSLTYSLKEFPRVQF